MWRFIKILASIVIVLAVLVVVAVVALSQIDMDSYKSFVASTVEKRTGRVLTIDGEVSFKPSLSPTLVVEDVKFENAGFASDPYMFTAQRLEGELELKPLLNGDIQIRGVKLIEPQLFLERGHGELRNWRFRKQRKRPNIPVLLIDKAEIQGGRVVYTNSVSGFRYEYKGQSAHAWLREGTQIVEAVADGLLDGVQTHAEGTFGELEHIFLPGQASQINLTANTAQIDWDINGTVKDAIMARGVNIDLAAHTDSTANIDVFTKFPIPDFGIAKATARLAGDPSAFTLGGIAGEVVGEREGGTIQGWIEELGKSNRMELSIKGEAESLVEFLAAFDRKWWLDGKVSTAFLLQGVKKDYSLDDVTVNMSSADIDATLTGSVGTVSRLRNLNFDIDYTVDDISIFSERMGTPLPVVGPAIGTASLSRSDGAVTLEDIQADIESDLVVVKATGAIQDAGKLHEMNIELEGRTEQPSILSETLRYPLPEIGDLRFDAQLIRGDDAYRIERLSAGLSTPEFNIGVSGLIDDLRGLQGLDLEVSVLTDSLDQLSEITGYELPASNALQSFGRVFYESNESKRAHIDSTIKGENFTASIAGTVDNLLRFDGVESTIQLNAESLDELSRIFKTDFPEFNNLKLAGTVRHSQGIAAQTQDAQGNVIEVPAIKPVTWVDAVLASGNTQAKVQGNIDFDQTPKVFDLKLDVSTKTLADLEPITGTRWPAVGPVTGTSNLRVDESGYAFNGFKLKVDGSDLLGDAVIVPGQGNTIPVITGSMTSDVLDLRPFLANEETDSSKKKEPWFSDKPFEFDFVRGVRMQLDIKAGQLLSRWTHLDNMQTQITTQDGRLQMPLTANLNPGSVDMRFDVDTNQHSMPVAFKLLAADVDTEQISNIRDENIVQDGNIDLDILINGSGASMDELMAGADGHILLTMNSGQISQTVLRLIGADILWQMAHMLNPFGKRRNYLDLECGVFGFRIEDGIAHSNKWIATRSKEVAVIGAGVINLDTEDVEIALTPKAREGIGISASSLVKLVRLGGSLSDLKAEADPAGLLKSGASIGAAVASGGLSLLAQGLFDRVTANNRLCQKTLDNFHRGVADNGTAVKTTKAPVDSRKLNGNGVGIEDRK
ncbi:MAG: AsmA family protein [Gammaproteobacteria bacterium]|nr:AsmA family protein [Gammaproteobacteria bacterium]